jgi:acyl carrier protein
MTGGITVVRTALLPRLASVLGVEEALVGDDLELATLGLSSLELMELVYDVEDDLGVTFVEEHLAAATTVGTLLAAMAADLAEAGSGSPA